MPKRANIDGEKETNYLVEDVESGKPMRKNAYELMRLRDAQSFIAKLYWLVVICFLAIGVIIAAVLSDGTFRDVFMAETLLSTIGITSYLVIVLMMIMCHSHKEMRVLLLLFIVFFIGMVAGFLTALHLLDVTIHLGKGLPTIKD